jgi:hypothetical protein
MFASIRRYRLQSGEIDDLTRRVDTGFAEEVSGAPGFVSYEFVDCGGGDMTTVSIFREEDQAEASRDLAQRWTDANLQDMQFERLAAMRGEVLVSRAGQDMLEPGHVGAGRGCATLRRYRAGADSIPAIMHIADTEFADDLAALDGFEAYHVIDCGGGEILAMNCMRDRSGIEECDRLAQAFVRDKLADFEIERTENISGDVVVSRAMAELLEPAHA